MLAKSTPLFTKAWAPLPKSRWNWILANSLTMSFFYFSSILLSVLVDIFASSTFNWGFLLLETGRQWSWLSFVLSYWRFLLGLIILFPLIKSGLFFVLDEFSSSFEFLGTSLNWCYFAITDFLPCSSSEADNLRGVGVDAFALLMCIFCLLLCWL